MNNIDYVINDVINNVDNKDALMHLNEIVNKIINGFEYRIDGCVITTNMHTMYYVKRKIDAKMHLSFNHKYIVRAMLDRLESEIRRGHVTIERFRLYRKKRLLDRNLR